MIGILTFYWADDYGAMLQAYALKHYLEKYEKKEVEIIPYAPVKLEGRYRLFPIICTERQDRIKYSFINWGILRNVMYLHSFLKRRKNMRTFRQNYLTRKSAVKRPELLSLKDYSCVFVGSDQVWNPEITVGLDDAYIGNVKEKGSCRLIAYGASFGSSLLPSKYRARFAKTVNKNFSSISLREYAACPFIKSFFHGEVTDVLDPTLLLDRKEWEKLEKLPCKQDYILFIYTEYNKQMLQYLQYLAVELKKRVVQISMPWFSKKMDWIDMDIQGGPSEFIGFFHNASYVITNSFHGMAFSILMEKQFLVFSHSNRNARMISLLKKLQLESRLIERGRIPTKAELLQNIDWDHVIDLLEKERLHSIEFIKKGCQ